MSKVKHSLSNVNTTKLTASCSICGDVSVVAAYSKQYSKMKYTCKIAHFIAYNKHRTKTIYGNREGYQGISLEEFLANRELLDAQTACQICGVSFEETRACVDHDHKTGKIRGKLCTGCNTAIGNFNDDLELLSKAIEYLMLYSIK